MKKFYKWFKVVEDNTTMVEVSKNYFSDDDEFINEENGWTKLENDFIEIEIEE